MSNQAAPVPHDSDTTEGDTCPTNLLRSQWITSRVRHDGTGYASERSLGGTFVTSRRWEYEPLAQAWMAGGMTSPRALTVNLGSTDPERWWLRLALAAGV